MQTILLANVLEKYLNLNISDGEHWSVEKRWKNVKNDFFAMCETIFVTVSTFVWVRDPIFLPQVEIYKTKLPSKGKLKEILQTDFIAVAKLNSEKSLK